MTNKSRENIYLKAQNGIFNFARLTLSSFTGPERALLSIGNQLYYGVIGYAVVAFVLILFVNGAEGVEGFQLSSDDRELALASILVVPFMFLIPTGFVHLNASAMNMGGSFWSFYGRVLWSIYIYFLALLVTSVIIYVLGGIMPGKITGFFFFLPHFYVLILFYLSLKVTNDLPHWKTGAILLTSGGLFYLAVILFSK